MVLNLYGQISLWTFVGGNGVLILFLPYIVSGAVRHFLAAWWLYVLTLYFVLAIAVIRATFKDYQFKVKHIITSSIGYVGVYWSQCIHV